MKFRLLKRAAAIVLLTGTAILGTAPDANAGLSVTLEQTSGPSGSFGPVVVPIVPTAGGELAIFASTFGDFQFEFLSVLSNASLTNPTEARISDLSISTRNTSGGDATLVITVLDDSFTTPGVDGDNMILTNSLSSSSLVGGSASFESNLDGVSTPAVSLTGPGQVENSIVTPRGGPTFTLGNVLTITLAAAGTANIDATTTAVVPEPATLAAALLGLPLAGVGAWMRRRKLS